MKQAQTLLDLRSRGRGLTDITSEIDSWLAGRNIRTGLATLFLQHTSASLTIQENADPDVLADLETFLAKIAPDDPKLYRHVMEGADDMPAHIRTALTQTSLQIPIKDGRLALGTWQAVYLWEHRTRPHERRLVVHVIGE